MCAMIKVEVKESSDPQSVDIGYVEFTLSVLSAWTIDSFKLSEDDFWKFCRLLNDAIHSSHGSYSLEIVFMGRDTKSDKELPELEEEFRTDKKRIKRELPCDYHYTDDLVQGVILLDRDGKPVYGNGKAATFLGYIANVPIRPATVVIFDGSDRITDDGNGKLVGAVGRGINRIDYVTGMYCVTFADTPVDGTPITCDYEYDSMGRKSDDYADDFKSEKAKV